eukprot:TRINITY_DN5330_c0_g1_i3.p1 TRINITY_DN5330_c0_g1~~TRINITY_DN5330_c0_g1_i3.p1  ORF type:complete len:3685 (-),score=1128.16 TRINITY_DN5330_c0_g1_i3:1844-12898(-)
MESELDPQQRRSLRAHSRMLEREEIFLKTEEVRLKTPGPKETEEGDRSFKRRDAKWSAKSRPTTSSRIEAIGSGSDGSVPPISRIDVEELDLYSTTPLAPAPRPKTSFDTMVRPKTRSGDEIILRTGGSATMLTSGTLATLYPPNVRNVITPQSRISTPLLPRTSINLPRIALKSSKSTSALPVTTLQPKKQRLSVHANFADDVKPSSSINSTEVKASLSKSPSQNDETHFFPLEIFDNSDFETRTPEEWLQFTDDQGRVRAYSKWYSNDGKNTWEPCSVLQYNHRELDYTIQWDSNNQLKRVSRLNLRFRDEDPAKFAKRLEVATANRKISETFLRRNIRIEMLDNGMQSNIPADHWNNILQFVSHIEDRDPELFKILTDEVTQEYQRTNRVIEYDLEHPVEDSFEESLRPIILEMLNTEAHLTLVHISERSLPFQELLQILQENIIYGSPHIVKLFFVPPKVMKKDITAATLWDLISQIRHLPFLQSIDISLCSLQDFTYDQQLQFKSTVEHIRTEITPNVDAQILLTHSNEGQNKDREFMRYVRLMNLINAMVKDSLRIAATQSIISYSSLFTRYNCHVHSINSNFEGYLESKDRQHWMKTNSPPIFTIKAGMKNGEISFEPAVSEFKTVVAEIVKEMIDATQSLECYELSTLNYRYSSDKLTAISEDEECVTKVMKEIFDAIDDNGKLLKQYQQVLSEYQILLKEDKDHFVHELMNKKFSIGGFRAEIIANLKYEERMLERIEDHFPLGLFLVDCTWLRTTVSTICHETRAACLEAFRQSTFEELKSTEAKFISMKARLAEVPTTPQELSSITEYVKKVSVEQFVLQQKIDTILKRYSILEEFRYEISGEEFNEKWNLFSWPQNIKRLIADADKANQIIRWKMIRELRNNQKTLEETIFQFAEEASEIDRFKDIENAITMGDRVRTIFQELQAAREKARMYAEEEKLFFYDVDAATTNQTLMQLIRDFEPLYTLWVTASDWTITTSQWFTSAFTSLSSEMMSKFINNSLRITSRIIKIYKGVKEAPAGVAAQLRQKVEEWKELIPMLTKLRHPGVRARHWDTLAKELKLKLPAESEFTLGFVLQLHLEKHMEVIASVTDVAINEFTHETALDKMTAELRNMVFELVAYKDTGTYVLTLTEELMGLVDDQLVTLQTMLGSHFIVSLIERARDWKIQLKQVQTIVDEWMLVQQQWLYLQPIFSSDDINRQLPTEGRRFAAVEATWRKVMEEAKVNPKVLVVCGQEKLLKQLQECNKLLDLILKGLNEYLELKRMSFPRFYFLSNDELLDILAQSKNPKAVEPHLRKCFENIVSLKFSENGEIKTIYSAEGEKVNLTESVMTNKDVELWLLELESAMRSTLKKILARAIASYTKMTRENWVHSWPAQILLTANQILFTQSVTEAIQMQDVSELKSLRAKLIGVLESSVSMVRGDVGSLMRSCIGALLVLDVHNRDVLASMIQEKVRKIDDFDWTSQLRYYWEDGTCVVRMLDGNFDYGYEYLGNTPRLVLTNLTDRCYRTLTSALHFNLGGAPCGPAGTGKTETVKDLAKAIAKQCVVFNCSATLDYKALGKLFKGLASTGGWSCLDEFNRIDIGVLSVVAQQILTIQQAVNEKAQTFSFEGTNITLNRTCAIFITMNPDTGYAGRSELPDNLKSLFRPVSMVVPDYAYISEILLLSEGFQSALPLSRKMTECFKIAAELLSQQHHYDFGLRAVRTALSMAGALKRREPNLPEDVIMLKTLRDSNVPKFVDEDIPIFMGLLRDLFPKIDLSIAEINALSRALSNSMQEMTLQPIGSAITKCLQLYDTLSSRHGVMLVGRTCSGKTTCYEVLARTLNHLSKESGQYPGVNITIINPKSITIDQLFGVMTPSLEWRDGVLSKVVRELSSAEDSSMHWIVLDGPVDSLWIESMNTALDDNKLLCLTNGERIPISPNVRFLFEVADLTDASPATISRLGMVFMESNLGWRVIVKSWLQHLPENFGHAKIFEDLFVHYMDDILKYVIKFCKPVVNVEAALLNSMLNILNCFMDYIIHRKDKLAAEESRNIFDVSSEVEIKNQWWEIQESAMVRVLSNFPTDPRKDEILEALFLFSLIWSIGVNFDAEGRVLFDTLLRDKIKARGPRYQNPFPAAGQVYDYLYHFDERRWITWMDLSDAQAFKVDITLSFHEIIIPTKESLSREYIMQLLVRHGRPILLCGQGGVGKTAEISQMLLDNLPENFVPLIVNFTRSTTALQLQKDVEEHLERRKGKILGASLGKRVMLFVDNFNVTKAEDFNAQPPIELLRQFLDQGGWFDHKEKTFQEVKDLQIIAASGPVTEDTQIDPRFLRHFNIIYCAEPSEETLERILGMILEAFMKGMNPVLKKPAKNLPMATIKLYRVVLATLLPTSSKIHYAFNLRDLWRIFKGIILVLNSQSNTPVQFIRLWAHECLRVWGDRLTSENDRSWLLNEINEIATQILEYDGPIIAENMIFSKLAATQLYEEIPGIDRVIQTMRGHLHEYNNSASKLLGIHLFPDAVLHVTRMVRGLSQPESNLLLLGAMGSGRRSLARLAAHVTDFQFFEVAITRSYGIEEWREDLKKILKTAGLQAETSGSSKPRPILFLFRDSQILMESFLEDINNIIHNGHVPDLFLPEEVDSICQNFMTHSVVRRTAAHENKVTNERHWRKFVTQVKKNLHVVLCLDPTNSQFKQRIRMFPSLVSRCTIDWYTAWGSDALKAVARHTLSTKLVKSEQYTIEQIVEVCVYIHQTMVRYGKSFRRDTRRAIYVTPNKFQSLLTQVQNLTLRKRNQIENLIARLSSGLDKLQEVARKVAELQINLEATVPVLEKTSEQMETLMKVLTENREEAANTKQMVEMEESMASQEAQEAKNLAESAEAQLAEALPALEIATKSLNKISRKDVTEIKSFAAPPPGMLAVIEALCMLLGRKAKKDDYWAEARIMFNEPHFIQKLLDFNIDNVKEETILKLKPYINDPSFTPAAVEKSSVACKSLCAWIRAVEHYYWVSKAVEPKRRQLERANSDLHNTLTKLENSRTTMIEIGDKIDSLASQFEEAKLKRQQLELKVTVCQAKLTRAKKLIGGLGGERIRWERQLKDLRDSLQTLMGDAILAAGFIIYLGPFTADYRIEILANWKSQLTASSVKFLDRFGLAEVLGDPIQIRSWHLVGLPHDTHSIENAINCFEGERWPLMIDPQGQANKWIRGMEKNNKLIITSFGQPDFLRLVENCIHFGTPLLIEGIDQHVDPIIEPILLKYTFKAEEGLPAIRIGDKVVTYNDKFRLYMTSKHPNPQFPLELCSQVNLINFGITPTGLEEQLLNTVVRLEREELEQQKTVLMESIASNKRDLKEIEDKTLFLLYGAEGDILEDERLIDTLAASKHTSDEIVKRLEQSIAMESAIQSARIQYQPVACRASILYFSLADMSAVNHMYQFSLQTFIQMFTSSIIKAEPSDELATRVFNLNDYFTYSVYRTVSYGLFERDKLLFAFLMAIAIQQHRSEISPHEWHFLITGGLTTRVSASLSEHDPDHVTILSQEDIWKDALKKLNSLSTFSGISDEIYPMDHTGHSSVHPLWKDWLASPNPQKQNLPGKWELISPFQKLVLYRALRPDKAMTIVQQYISERLGPKFVDVSSLDLSLIYENSTPYVPIVFILSPGENPTDELFNFAAKKRHVKENSLFVVESRSGTHRRESD